MSWTTDQQLTAASIGGGLIDSVGNWITQRENRQTQIDLMREQNAFQEKMYERQLRDNSPLAQMSNLASAGFNPALNFGNVSDVSTPSVGSAPMVDAPQTNFSDVSLNAASAINALSAASKDSEEAKGLNIDNQYKSAEWLKRLDDLDAKIDEMRSQKNLNDTTRNKIDAEAVFIDWQRRELVQSLGYRIQGYNLENQLTEAKRQMVIAQQRDFDASAALKDAEAKLKGIGIKYEPQRIKAAIDSMLADAAANNKLAAKYSSDKGVADELKRKYGIEADQADAISQYIVPRVKSEIYRNSLGHSDVHLGPVSYGGTRSAYEHMFQDLGTGNKYERKMMRQFAPDSYYLYNKYGNGD